MAHCETMQIQSVIATTLFACLPAGAGERPSVAEFTPEESGKLDWNVVDDGVMGGLSQGKREIGKDGRHFSISMGFGEKLLPCFDRPGCFQINSTL
jgi:hypothetical protein